MAIVDNNFNKLLIEQRLEIISNLEKKFLNVTLSEEQIQALSSIIEFIHSNNTEFVLSGSAGTGKSLITKLIVRYLEQINRNYLLATPTNKACGVLSKYTERNVTTLHKLLYLKPSIDILKLDFKDLQWSTESSSSDIPILGVVIIDECSMINSVLYDFIIEKVNAKGSKVIFIGDSKQLYPVKEHALSKPFQCKNKFELTQIHRQSNSNPILNVLSELRYRSLNKFSEINSEFGNLRIYKHWRELLNDNINLFKEAVKTKNSELIKLLAYTNRRVEAFNNVIRKSVFEDDLEYHIGEILMGYDNSNSGVSIMNSEEFVVLNKWQTTLRIGFVCVSGYTLKLKSLNNDTEAGEVFIISRDNSKETFENIAAYLETLRLDAINCKNKRMQGKLWKDYFSVVDSFLTPYDLVFEDRIVRKKSIDYGYCISVHKSQGSNYDNVLVDMNNLFICNNKEELRQLQYVALSRTRNNVSLLI